MGTITLSVPDELKAEMSSSDWVNWSSVARRAFAETLADVEELKMLKKVREISEISDDDKREVREDVVKEVVASTERTIAELESGKRKAMTIDEFHKWCDSL